MTFTCHAAWPGNILTALWVTCDAKVSAIPGKVYFLGVRFSRVCCCCCFCLEIVSVDPSSKGNKGKYSKLRMKEKKRISSDNSLFYSLSRHNIQCFVLLSIWKKKRTAYVSRLFLLLMYPLKVLSLTNDTDYMKQVSFVDALIVIFYDGDLDEPDSNPLFSVFLINFKSESFAEH